MRNLGTVDFMSYLRAFGLLARNPQLALAPLLAGVINVLLLMLFPVELGAGFFGTANTSLAQLLAQLVWYVGLGFALIGAEAAWRRGRAPFDDTFEEGKRKLGDLAMAAFGYTFIVSIGGVLAGSIGLGVLGLVIDLIATYFFIYTVPAAAIGGVPGFGALEISLQRAKRAPLATFFVTVLFIGAFDYAPSLILEALSPLLLTNAFFVQGTVINILVAAIKAIVAAYVALVLAKAYDDASYGRFR
jgi:hypothetical protein